MPTYDRRVTEADIRAVLAATYTPEGVDIWWRAPNRNLGGCSPRQVFDMGYGLSVMAEAEHVADVYEESVTARLTAVKD